MIALILARGGSKRLPNKNILMMAGKPLIHYTLETALAAKNIDRVILSTDSEEIRDIALQINGVEAPFLRPNEFATDTAQAADVHFHAIDWFKENEGLDIKNLCLLLPTSPLRLPEDIDGAINLYKESNADIVTSIVRAKPLAWHQNIDQETKQMTSIIDMDNRDAVRNHQEMPDSPVYLNGSVYVLNIDKYRKTRSYFGDKTYGYEMPLSRSIDIDERQEFEIAEALLNARK